MSDLPKVKDRASEIVENVAIFKDTCLDVG